MLADKLKQFDTALRERHSEFHTSLRPGLSRGISMSSSVGEWFAWRDGQPHDTTTLFLDTYRFVPLDEARMQARSARSAFLTSPIQAMALAVFARRMLYSWPLIVDGAGEGYFFSTVSRQVFYKFEGERDRAFSSFEAFLDLLIELATVSARTEQARIERELELIDEYAR